MADAGSGASPQEQIGRAAGAVREQVASVAGDVSRKIQDQASNLGDAVRNARSDATDRLWDAAEDQKSVGADYVSGLADAVRQAGDALEQQVPFAGDYIRQAASGIDSAADAIRRRDLNEMVQGVQDFARRQPTAFLGLTALAGFAAVRFLKSTAPAPEPQLGGSENERHLAGAASRLPQGGGA